MQEVGSFLPFIPCKATRKLYHRVLNPEVLGTCDQPFLALSHLPIQRFGQHFEKSEKIIRFSADIKCNQSMPGKPQEKQLKETMIQ